MQSDADDIVADAVCRLLGGAPLHSAEDLVVALSLAILGRLGFEPREPGAAWAAPGLPQAQHTANLTYVNSADPGSAVEAKWVAMGPRVVLLVQPQSAGGGSSSDVCSIQLAVADLLAPTATFPSEAQDAQSVATLLAPDAVAVATTAIRRQLIDDAGPGRSSPPRAPLLAAPGPQTRSALGGAFPGLPSVGRGDLDPLGMSHGDPGAAGMLFGPGHPMFQRSDPPSGQDLLPPGAVPPGARFDPILPPQPGRGPGRGMFPGGGPNPDAGGPPDSSWNFDI